MASSETIFGGTTGYVWSVDDDVTYYVPDYGLTDAEVTFLDNNYSATDDLQGDLSGVTYTPTGQDAQVRFGQYVQSYTPSAARHILNATVAAAPASYDQVTTQGTWDIVSGLQEVAKTTRGL
jgi:hypothetical protein